MECIKYKHFSVHYYIFQNRQNQSKSTNFYLLNTNDTYYIDILYLVQRPDALTILKLIIKNYKRIQYSVSQELLFLLSLWTMVKSWQLMPTEKEIFLLSLSWKIWLSLAKWRYCIAE